MTVDAINLLRRHFREIKWEYLPPFCSTMMSSPSTILLQWQWRWFKLTRSTDRTGRSDVAAVTSCLHWRALWIQQHSRLRSLWEWRFELVTHPALKKLRKKKKKRETVLVRSFGIRKMRTSKLFENNIWYTKMHRYMKPSCRACFCL